MPMCCHRPHRGGELIAIECQRLMSKWTKRYGTLVQLPSRDQETRITGVVSKGGDVSRLKSRPPSRESSRDNLVANKNRYRGCGVSAVPPRTSRATSAGRSFAQNLLSLTRRRRSSTDNACGSRYWLLAYLCRVKLATGSPRIESVGLGLCQLGPLISHVYIQAVLQPPTATGSHVGRTLPGCPRGECR